MMLRKSFFQPDKHLAFKRRDHALWKKLLPWFEQLLKNNGQQGKRGNATNKEKSGLA